jgi:rare lipoprotein A
MSSGPDRGLSRRLAGTTGIVVCGLLLLAAVERGARGASGEYPLEDGAASLSTACEGDAPAESFVAPVADIGAPSSEPPAAHGEQEAASSLIPALERESDPELPSGVAQAMVAESEALPATPSVAATPFQTGKASYYHPSLEGRPTASGEPYRGGELTAAHRSLPFGTVVRVVNPRNGRSVMVRINDRGPFVSRRVIDLSKAAARELRMVQQGVVAVHLEIVED